MTRQSFYSTRYFLPGGGGAVRGGGGGEGRFNLERGWFECKLLGS